MATPSSRTERPVVLYDADCGFCRWSLAKLLAWDRGRRLRPVAIQSSEGERLLAGLTPDQRLASWHFVSRSGVRRSGGIAVVPLLRELPLGSGPAALLSGFPEATERAYGWVVRHRGTLGRLLPAGARRRADIRLERRTNPSGPG